MILIQFNSLKSKCLRTSHRVYRWLYDTTYSSYAWWRYDKSSSHCLTDAGAFKSGFPINFIFSLFGDAPYHFMPIFGLLSFTKLKVTPALAMSVAGILLHPNFVQMVSSGDPLHF